MTFVLRATWESQLMFTVNLQCKLAAKFENVNVSRSEERGLRSKTIVGYVSNFFNENTGTKSTVDRNH